MHDLVIRFFLWKIETSLRIRMHSIFVYVTCYSDNLWVRSLTLRKWKSDLISVWKEEDTIKFNGSKVKEIEVVDDGMMEGHENGRVGLSQRQSLSLMFFFCFLKPSLYNLHVHLLPCVSFFFLSFYITPHAYVILKFSLYLRLQSTSSIEKSDFPSKYMYRRMIIRCLNKTTN